ncbi:MAG: hypothetical protein JSW05_12755 [Candidatus Thorarchaeota archaeon]|nr:MAG: hypothetical protein JSW05_12755 [Candidatus Thorarchaeota archaeon]
MDEKSEPSDEETEEIDEAALEVFVGQVEDVLSKPAIDGAQEPADAATNEGKKIRSMMSDALGKLDEIEKSLTRTVPITKEDWIQALPSHVNEFFFEEELKQLGVEDLEDLSKLTRDQLEELVGSMSSKAGTDKIDVEDSATAIPEALQQVSRPETKKELIKALPKYIRMALPYKRLEAMSEVDLEEMALLSPEKFKKLLKILKEHPDWKDVWPAKS